jgi:hypothetical protein
MRTLLHSPVGFASKAFMPQEAQKAQIRLLFSFLRFLCLLWLKMSYKVNRDRLLRQSSPGGKNLARESGRQGTSAACDRIILVVVVQLFARQFLHGDPIVRGSVVSGFP